MDLRGKNYPIMLGTTKRGEQEVAPEGGEMTKVISRQNPEGAVKVSRKFVAMLDELKDVRAISNSAEKRIAELRKAIFDEVGERSQTLIHNGVEVAVISEQTKEVVDLDKLRLHFPEEYRACLVVKKQYPIRSVTRQTK